MWPLLQRARWLGQGTASFSRSPFLFCHQGCSLEAARKPKYNLACLKEQASGNLLNCILALGKGEQNTCGLATGQPGTPAGFARIEATKPMGPPHSRIPGLAPGGQGAHCNSKGVALLLGKRRWVSLTARPGQPSAPTSRWALAAAVTRHTRPLRAALLLTRPHHLQPYPPRGPPTKQSRGAELALARGKATRCLTRKLQQ